MKLLKIICTFIIFYFVVTISSSVESIGNFISNGNHTTKIGYYVFLIILTLHFVVVPLLKYIMKPSLNELKKLGTGDLKTIKKFRKHLIKLKTERVSSLIWIPANDAKLNLKWIQSYYEEELEVNRKFVKSMAIKLTTTVFISPNAFIDGLTVFFGDIWMLYQLSRNLSVRYSAKQLFNVYFGAMSMGSVIGIVQEFDDEIEELIQSFIVEFNEFVAEESGKTVSESVPIANIVAKTMGPIFQAAANYGFVLFTGNHFLLTIENSLNDLKLTDEALKKTARRKARKERYAYIKDLSRKVAKGFIKI